ncbi:MAG: hypothetical protein A2900_03315 [Candidatus Chisholmbacteria bacterium RIFCSPLOWO2_01_FULL_50_28]|uniref:Glycosyl transferase family 1 domain-containing protein n=1 Tax=Candidatus Chisholmbacteria bacterium RIFCSPHIGHO2_01_FULL_52_32 TaxID=1797591 RepID=A0A1G1VSY8_9BACT|nr:MAG: hypothetical protein A2786_03430 [Candidatus Chisholmbacteria bacterium RIFCSPHIGHO2_01_FULL_52_32]OGY20106.1 MAG: hypothetical protein A2900_03315 [Candidatus Chisholmbacteria bacterium RIFCSPLOWO2_01_FULL_50_28]
MKILIVTPIFPPQIGGPATYTFDLAKRLAGKHELTIVTFGVKPKKVEAVKIMAVPLHNEFFGTIRRQTALASAIGKEARRNDVIYTQGAVVVGFASALIAKLTGKPLILKFVGDEVWEEAHRKGMTNLKLEEFLGASRKPLFFLVAQWLQKQSLKTAKKIVVPSVYLKNIVTKFYGIEESKIEVINNAVEIQRPKRITQSKRTIILSSGRLVPHKRFGLLISAFNDLLKRVPKDLAKTLELQIIGDGNATKELLEMINTLNLSKKVKLVGRLERETYLQRLRMVKIFVLVSSYEGLSHAIIEAMLSEVPVVASDIPGNREVIEHEKTGLLTKTATEDLSDAIKRMLTDEELTKQIKLNAKRNAQQRFGWRTNIERLVHLLREESSSA